MNKSNKKCEGCGGTLKFSPLSQNLVCEKCEKTFEIEKNYNIAKHNIDQDFNKLGLNDKYINIAFSCCNCGANLNNQNLNYSTTCIYCGSNAIVADFSNSEIKPDSIIPFVIDKKNLYTTFKQNIKHKPFLPNAFKKSFDFSNTQAFYFPSFNFDCNTKNNYNGVLCQTKTDSDGRTYTHRYKISGVKNIEIKNFSIESSSNLTQSQLEGIKPYNFKEAQVFNQDFLRGFETEYHNCTIQESYKLSRPLLNSYIKEIILSNYSYSSIETLNITSEFNDEKYCYCLLPAYKISCIYKNKTYNTIMNGQTGKVDGHFPKSKVKIFFAILLILLVFTLFFILPIILD